MPRRVSLTQIVLAASPLGLVTALFRLPRERHRRAALEALARVELDGQAYQPGATLDPEGRVRLAVARALSRRPEWIVIRDVDLVLDRAVADRILALLHRIVRQEQTSVLASLASLALACKFADRLISLTDGLLTFDGPPSRFRERSPVLDAG